ncbi:uncharacterized protein PSANT_01239 [Moesziomyces antarcticus]|uniref:Uncharacterized protein n=1 Tax=Pseudozyma antarctica TaxID=84753 RepID=A0A5C3FGM0_PSEA2|nr:uncharacterized protein PSANT_01239 [Moesziomyces antarcticus]
MAFNNTEAPVNTCMPATCDKCGKTTWRGCGAHIESVKATVPKDQWCECPRS